MSESPILTDLDGDGVLTITFNRPQKKNTFNKALWLGFRDALNEARENDHVTVAVLTGAGKDFSAGVDLTDFGGDENEPQPYDLFMEAFCAFDKPLLAAAKGFGIGGGATILLHCDVVYVGQSVRLRFPFANLGLVTEFAASYLMPVVLGLQQASELLFTAEWIDADRALETGIAKAIFPDHELLQKSQEKAREIAQWPLSALREIKRCIKLHHEAGIKAALAAEREGMRKLAGSPENIEAITAFLEKREPDFKKLKDHGEKKHDG
jgi:enoyl-CoA hydratase/carnithine racemase